MERTIPAAVDPWVLVYDGFVPEQEGLREALCALGNGLFVTRGAAEESTADGTHYPGTYLAGGYNQLSSEIAGHTVVNEDLVNFPNWLTIRLRMDDGEWISLSTAELLSYRQELHLRDGVLLRRYRIRDAQGRITAIESRRIVSMHSPHHAAIEYSVTPENWSGTIRIHSEIDGTVSNTGVARYRQLATHHLELLGAGGVAPEGCYLIVETNHSRIQVGTAARTRVFQDDRRVETERRITGERTSRIGEERRVPVTAGETVRVEKVVALYSSRHRGVAEPGTEARLALAAAADFATMLDRHRTAWLALWRRYDIEIGVPGETRLAREQLILRLHIFHLLQTISPHTVGLDVGAPARGLHGEAYRGHVFWDELFVFPFYNFRTPVITRSLLLYRYYRLDAARELARAAGCRGAMFPWQSSSDGREATQQLHLNPLSGLWGPDYSHLQRHVNGAIVYNLWRYWQVTGDLGFLIHYGAEMMLEIARLWASLAQFNQTRQRYEIAGVMGPDEYHERYPDSHIGGICNNAYTNVLAVWCLLRTLDMLELVGHTRRTELLAAVGIDQDELQRWEDITRKMFIPFHGDGIISQFEGYDTLDDFDWENYRARFGNIERLDRILKAEHDSTDHYKISKQADVNMLFYLFEKEPLRELFERLKYPFDDTTIQRNISYYMERTSHGSTLSKMVFASVVHELDCNEGCRLFFEALRSDIDDTQKGTTAEGIHVGAMAGTVAIVLHRYAGFHLDALGPAFMPEMPDQLEHLRFRVHWQSRWLDVDLTPDRLRITADQDQPEPIPVTIRHKPYTLQPGTPLEVSLHMGSGSIP